MNAIKKFWADETGLELSEYAIAAAIIVAGIGLLFTEMGTAIKAKITALHAEITK